MDSSDNAGSRKATENASIYVAFGKPFAKTAVVFVWFTELSQPKDHRSLQRYVKDVTLTGVRINIETWDGPQFDGVRVAYLVYPANSDAIKGKGTSFGRKEDWRVMNWPGGSFKSEPLVFTAIDMIDVGENEETMNSMVNRQPFDGGPYKTLCLGISLEGSCWMGVLC